MKLKEMIQYSPDETRPQTAQGKALRMLAGFLVLMVLCTALSRAADSLTVAKVLAESPSRAAILHTVSASGRLEADSESAVAVLPGVRVKSVAVSEGTTVKAGDPLFTLDLADIKEQYTKENMELQKLGVQLAEARRRQEVDAERAGEDYDLADEISEDDVQAALESSESAESTLSRFRKENRDTINSWRDNEIDPTDPDFAIINEYRSLLADYRAKDSAYQDALRQREDQLLKARRTVEDTQETGSSIKTLSIDYQLKQMSMNKLAALIKAEGVVTAEIDAIVTQVWVSAGKSTPGDAALMLTEQAAGFRFVAQVTKDQLEYISRGDDAQVSFSGTKKTVRNVTVESIRASAENENLFDVTIRLPAGEGELGAAGAMEVNRKTDNYNTCIPLDALHSEGNKNYVLVLREVQTVMGTELAAERVDVVIEDQNESRAAVTGALSSDDKVILSSSKSIGDGDRVREEKAS